MTTTTKISCYDKVIDSRDVIARIDSLTEEFTVDMEDASDVLRMADFDQEEVAELGHLLALQSEAEAYSDDWRHGATLVHEDHFKDYAQQLADDIGAVASDAKWPNNHIDWEAAAEELKQDYTAVEFNGETFYVR